MKQLKFWTKQTNLIHCYDKIYILALKQKSDPKKSRYMNDIILFNYNVKLKFMFKKKK